MDDMASEAENEQPRYLKKDYINDDTSIIFHSLRWHEEDRAVVIEGLQRLGTGIDKSNYSTVESTLPLLMKALCLFQKDSIVQMRVMDAIIMLSSFSEDHATALGDEDVCELVVELTRAASPTVPTVHLKCIQAMQALAKGSPRNARKLVQAGAVPILVSSLRTKMLKTLSGELCATLQALTVDQEFAQIVSDAGATEVMIEVIRNNPHDYDLLGHGLELLAKLAPLKDGRRMQQAGVWGVILKVLRTQKEENIQAWGFNVIHYVLQSSVNPLPSQVLDCDKEQEQQWRQPQPRQEEKESALALQCCEILVKALQTFSGRMDDVGWRTMALLCQRYPSCRTFLGDRLNACNLVVAKLQKTESPSVQLSCLEAITALANMDAANCRRLAQAGAISWVHSIIEKKQHTEDVLMLCVAWKAMAKLLALRPCQSRRLRQDDQFCEEVVHLFSAFPDNPNIWVSGLEVVSSLSLVIEENKLQLIQLGLFREVVLPALKRFPEDVDVVLMALRIIILFADRLGSMVMLQDHHDKEDAVENETYHAIADAMLHLSADFMESRRVQYEILHAIGQLACSMPIFHKKPGNICEHIVKVMGLYLKDNSLLLEAINAVTVLSSSPPSCCGGASGTISAFLSQGIASLLLSIGQDSVTDFNLQVLVLEAMSVLMSRDTGAMAFAELCRTPAHIIQVMTMHQEISTLQIVGTKVLRVLAESNDEVAVQIALHHGGLDLLARLLLNTSSSKSPALSKVLCDLISSLASVAEVNIKLGECGICEALVEIARSIIGDQQQNPLLAAATYAISTLSWTEANRARLLKMDCVADLLLATLNQLVEDAQIQAALFYAVGLLTTTPPPERSKLTKRDRANIMLDEEVACSVLLEGIKDFPHEALFQSEGCLGAGLLSDLSPSFGRRMWGNATVDYILDRLRRYPKDARLHINGWIALSRLWRCREQQQADVDAEAVELVVSALDYWHRRREMLVEARCLRALIALVTVSGNKQMFKNAGMWSWLVKALHQNSKQTTPCILLLGLYLDSIITLIHDSNESLKQFVHAGLPRGVVRAMAAALKHFSWTIQGSYHQVHGRGLELLEILVLTGKPSVVNALLSSGLPQLLRDTLATATAKPQKPENYKEGHMMNNEQQQELWQQNSSAETDVVIRSLRLIRVLIRWGKEEDVERIKQTTGYDDIVINGWTNHSSKDGSIEMEIVKSSLALFANDQRARQNSMACR